MRRLNHRDKWIVERCKDKHVLHLGCVDAPLLEERVRSGRLLHGKVLNVARRAVGVDLDASGIETLRRLYPDETFVVANAEAVGQAVSRQSYDVILAADILEHVANPGLMLQAAASLVAPTSELIITTPSAFSAKKFCCALLTGREHNHPDHTFFFSPMTLTRLAGMHGLRVREMYSFQWKNPTWKNWLVNSFAFPFVWVSRNLTADELAVVLVRQ